MRNLRHVTLILLPLLLLCGLLFSTVFASNPATIAGGSGTGLPGTTFDVPIEFENADQLGGGVFTLTYDPAVVTPVGIVNKNADLPWILPQDSENELEIVANLEWDVNEIRVAWAVDPSEGHPTSGVLGYIRLQMKRYSDTTLGVGEASLFSVEANAITSSTSNGTISRRDLVQKKYGDLNEDTFIDFNDAIMVLQQFVGLISMGPNQLQYANINQDSSVDFNDAILILQRFVGMNPPWPE